MWCARFRNEFPAFSMGFVSYVEVAENLWRWMSPFSEGLAFI